MHAWLGCIVVGMVSVATTAVAGMAVAGCGTMQTAAARDPQRCERDPTCTGKDQSKDCSLQCADDPACVDRCREINITTGSNSR